MKAATPRALTYNSRFEISIHAAREGGDAPEYKHTLFTVISIHAAREGGDSNRAVQTSLRSLFQSTPPVKAATDDVAGFQRTGDISIHAAREGGDVHCVSTFDFIIPISIHAAREGGDRRTRRLLLRKTIFQSTPPVKAATYSQIGQLWFF